MALFLTGAPRGRVTHLAPKILMLGALKGGVGKSTIAASLASTWAMRSGVQRRVLAIDLDPQGNLTMAFSADSRSAAGYGAAELFASNPPAVGECIVSTSVPGVDLVPAEFQSLDQCNHRLVQEIAGERALARALRSAPDVYDWIVLDTAPSLGSMLNLNALAAANYVVSPVVPSRWSAIGGIRVPSAVQEVVNLELGNPVFLGYVWNKITSAVRVAQQMVVEDVTSHNFKFFDTQVPLRVAAEDAEYSGIPFVAAEPQAEISRAFARLADEIDFMVGDSECPPAPMSDYYSNTPVNELGGKKGKRKGKGKKKGKKVNE